MIKRPFLWGIVAFIGGILLAWYKIPLIYLALAVLGGWLTIYLLMFHIKRYINYKDRFLWFLPFLIILGFFAMGDRIKPPDMDMAFEEKSYCNLTGEITMIVKKPWGMAYYLKDNSITLPDINTYRVEEIIVNKYTQTYQEEYKTKDIQTLKKYLELQGNQVSQHQETKSHEYRIGNIITVSGTIRKFSTNTNPGEFNEHLYYKSQNIAYKVNADNITLVDGNYSKYHSILDNIKEQLMQVYSTALANKEAGTLIAMVLGEKYLLEDEIKTLYQENGISHILAISGLHVSIIGAAIYYMLRKLRLGLVTSTIMSLAFVYSYGLLTNFSVSTNRALVMYSILLIAKLIGKTFDILSALSLSAFLILLQNPMELFQAGFLLSFGAVLGIALILPCLNHLYEAKNFLLKLIYVSISVHVITLPIVQYYFFQIPVYSVFINIIIVPLTSLLIIIALVVGMVGIISLPLGVFLAGGANYILILYEMACKIGSKLPKNLLTVGRPDTIRIIIYLMILSVFIISVKRYKRKRLLILIIVAFTILIIPKPREGLIVTMLDVGQGEAVFIEGDLGTSYLIGGGSSDGNQVGRYRITPYLLSRGIDTLDYAMVTHTDEDHVSGLIELIEREQISVKHLLLPDTPLKNEIYLKLEALATYKAIKLIYIVSGDMIIDGNMRIKILHPPVGYQPASNNDYSTVISISYGEFNMLLTGDIEAKGERELIKVLNMQEDMDSYHSNSASSCQLHYDILKVAHHGSRNSTSVEFLAIIDPKLSLISCGRNNKRVTRLIQFRFPCSSL